MEIAKALILAGTQSEDPRWPVSSGSRHLFPVANRPILFHNLEALRSAGIIEAAILAEPEAGAAIASAVGDGRDWGLRVRYANWNPGRGLRGALAVGTSFLGREPVLVEHGDALLRDRMQEHITTFAREELDALALRLEDPVVRIRDHATPGYLLSPLAVSILRDAGPRAANPLAHLRARGTRVRIERVDGCLPCHGDLDGLLESNRCILEDLETSVDPASLKDSTVHGAVHVHPTARVRRSLLRGPLVIGPDTTVTDAYIGPYTSIGERVVIESAEIEHSIVLPEAELRFVGSRLESSVIGRGARVVRGFDLPAATRLSLGDGAEVILK